MPRIVALLICLLVASSAFAQQPIPPPAGPVLFCVAQTPPEATSYRLIVDGGAPQAVTMGAPVAACPAGTTHTFTLPPATFPIGTHTVSVVSVNEFGETAGPVHTIVVGIKPGEARVVAVIPQ